MRPTHRHVPSLVRAQWANHSARAQPAIHRLRRAPAHLGQVPSRLERRSVPWLAPLIEEPTSSSHLSARSVCLPFERGAPFSKWLLHIHFRGLSCGRGENGRVHVLNRGRRSSRPVSHSRMHTQTTTHYTQSSQHTLPPRPWCAHCLPTLRDGSFPGRCRARAPRRRLPWYAEARLRRCG